MVSVGEAALASDYQQQLNLPPDVLTIDPEALAAAEARRRDQYLQVDLPERLIQMVDSPEQLEGAGEALRAAAAVGIDVEWQPSHQAGKQTPAALLQVRTAFGWDGLEGRGLGGFEQHAHAGRHRQSLDISDATCCFPLLSSHPTPPHRTRLPPTRPCSCLT